MKKLLITFIATICIFINQETKAYIIKSNCGNECIIKRNNNLYMVINASILSPVIKGTYSFRENYGRNIYFNHPTMYGIFIGTKFNDRLGMELGYETQSIKRRTEKVGPDDNLPGLIHIGDTVFTETKAKTEHFQALLNVRLNEFEQKNIINFWGQVGLSYSQVRAYQNILYVIEHVPPPPHLLDPLPPGDNSLVRTFKSKKLLPIIKIGVDCNITEKFGIRGSVAWSNLKSLKAKPKERPEGQSEIKLGEGYNVSVGVVYKFW